MVLLHVLKGFVEGEAFDGGEASSYELVLGSGVFVPGFEDQLLGTKAEDQVDVKVTFPTDYHAELAGKAAVFKVTVHEVKTKVVPELTDEFVAEQFLTLPELYKPAIRPHAQYESSIEEFIT